MIKDIPDSKDFRTVGINFFNLAWDSIIDLLLVFNIYEEAEIVDKEMEEHYWKASQDKIKTSYILVQQGVEMLLKGRIAEVSPYLLLSRNVAEWPKGCASQSICFSKFKMIDAQDLIKCYNTVREQKLSNNFVNKFTETRKSRNILIHTIDKDLAIKVEEVLDLILEFIFELFGEKKWAEFRVKYLEENCSGIREDYEAMKASLVEEFTEIVEVLSPAKLKKHFNFDKKQRSYVCLNCYYEGSKYLSKEPYFAQLSPNKPSATQVYCFLCNTTSDVTRCSCNGSLKQKCKGNVIDKKENICLSCREEQS